MICYMWFSFWFSTTTTNPTSTLFLSHSFCEWVSLNWFPCLFSLVCLDVVCMLCVVPSACNFLRTSSVHQGKNVKNFKNAKIIQNVNKDTTVQNIPSYKMVIFFLNINNKKVKMDKITKHLKESKMYTSNS